MEKDNIIYTLGKIESSLEALWGELHPLLKTDLGKHQDFTKEIHDKLSQLDGELIRYIYKNTNL
jgi:hypothetical protein